MTMIADDRPRDAHAVPGYRLLEVVDARPELGTTYRAHDLRRDGAVEVTLIAAVLSRNARYRECFNRRRGLLASLRHPALVRQLDAGEWEDGLFVVAEPAIGVPLHTMLEQGPLAPDRALAILEPVADLLDRLHAGRLCAGDLSPRRIVVREGDQASVIAPGLAGVSWLASARLEVSADAHEYSSPEQLRGLAGDARSDVYGLAAILFEAVTGRPLFGSAAPDAGTGLPIQAPLPRRALPAVSARHRRLGYQFDAVLKAALSGPPAMRPATPGDLLVRLQRAFEHGGSARPLLASDERRRVQTLERSAASRLLSRHEPSRPTQGTEAAQPTGGTLAAPAATVQRPVEVVNRTPPAGIRRSDRRSRPGLQGMRALAPVTAAAALATVMGLILAVSSYEPRQPADQPIRSLQVSAGNLRISYPSTWQIERARSGVAGARELSLTAPIALVPRAGVEPQPGSRLVAGMATVTGSSLLSPQVQRRLDGGVKPETVRLGAHEALRYNDVPLPGEGGHSTLYAVPTSAGVATIVCVSPSLIDTLAGQCEAIATTLAMSGADSLPLGPNVAYGRLVNRIVAQTDVARRRGRAQLRLAERAPGQAQRAADLATTFRRSAARLAAAGPQAGTADVHLALVAALHEVRTAYEALASAAARSDRRGYDAARRLVSAREAGLSRVLERMGDLGYQLRRG